jgi:hypothetical protein
MRKKLIKAVSVILSVCLCFTFGALCACGSSGDDKNKNDDKLTDGGEGEETSDGELIFKGISALSDTITTVTTAKYVTNNSVVALADTIAYDYTAYRNEDFYINVSFDNPNEYTILGLTISYAGETSLFPCSNFEDAGDADNIFVRVKGKKQSESSDVTQYAISNITYTDGTSIKQAKYSEGAKDVLNVKILQHASDTSESDAVTGTKLNHIDSSMLSSDGVLTIPDNITEIGEYAFAYNEQIKEIIIPDTVLTIDNGAFYDCLNVESVTIGAGVTFIGYNAFHYCENISYVNYKGSLANWLNIDFAYSAAEQEQNRANGVVDKNVRYSNPTFFAHDLHINGDLITEVKVPDGISQIKYGAFMRCTSITKVTLPQSVKSVGYYAFLTCSGLYDLDLGGVEVIDYAAFDGCYSLMKVTLPATLREIKGGKTGSNGAFGAAQKILEVYNLSEDESLDITCGSNNNGAVAKFAKYVYTSAEDVSKYETDNDGFVWFSMPDNQSEIYLVGYVGDNKEITVPYEKDGKQVILQNCVFAGNTVLTKVTFESGFTAIPDRAFAYCYSIQEVCLPDSVESIGDHAFWSCGIKKLVLPEKCVNIAQHAFSSNNGLEITLKAVDINFGKNAFQLCKNLTIKYEGTVAQWSAYVNRVNSAEKRNSILSGADFTAICKDGTYQAYGI